MTKLDNSTTVLEDIKPLPQDEQPEDPYILVTRLQEEVNSLRDEVAQLKSELQEKKKYDAGFLVAAKFNNSLLLKTGKELEASLNAKFSDLQENQIRKFAAFGLDIDRKIKDSTTYQTKLTDSKDYLDLKANVSQLRQLNNDLWKAIGKAEDEKFRPKTLKTKERVDELRELLIETGHPCSYTSLRKALGFTGKSGKSSFSKFVNTLDKREFYSEYISVQGHKREKCLLLTGWKRGKW